MKIMKIVVAVFFVAVVLISCRPSENLVPAKDDIPWDKLNGKLIAFNVYGFIADSKTKKIDTFLTQPLDGKSVYGYFGASYSEKSKLLLYTVSSGIYSSIPNYISFDGLKTKPFTHNSSTWIISPRENSNGLTAYLVGANNSDNIESLWIDNKMILDFSLRKISCQYYLDWHPSNEFLLLGSNGISELNVSDTTFRVVLPSNPRTVYYDAQYSPDGTKILFIKVDSGDSSGGSIFVINRDGSNLTKLSSFDVFDSYPTWSPDGRKIAYTVRSKGIYIMNADGTDNTLVFKGNPNKWIGDRLIWLR